MTELASCKEKLRKAHEEIAAAVQTAETTAVYVRSLEDGLSEMMKMIAELLETFLPEMKRLMPFRYQEMVDAIATMRKIRVYNEKEKAEKNETHT